MMLFEIECEHGNHKSIFARCEHDAVDQFVAWQMVNDAPMGSFIVQRITISAQAGLRAVQLREALGLGIQGIGVYDEHRGWQIGPVEDERPNTDQT